MKERQQEYIRRIGAGESGLIPELWELLQPLTRKFIRNYAEFNQSFSA